MSTPPSVEALVAEALRDRPRSSDLEARLVVYVEALLETNQSINLVSRRNTAQHVARFTRESLFLAQQLGSTSERGGEPATLLDLGSGGGFPGMVVKLALPDLQVTLVEGTQKKARFLADVCQRLDLRGIKVLWARAEALADRDSSYFKPELRHHFDWVTAKALGSIAESIRLAAPFLRLGGIHWIFKGERYEQELRSARRRMRQMRLETLRSIPVPGSEKSYLVAIKQLERS
ncbi:MAG: 16S rRNA (guanine(527)-N(7))-methyltransferase RsmG [Candidatus Latescibacterota bacterium]|nr:MAG: 16S rRNA (guanine(527)-N(7))-methyltransferase RsmG [Candidatus Latescibacterota bacterium]